MAVWARFAYPFLPNAGIKENITFFTVVPTIYNRLLATYHDLSLELQKAAKEGISPQNLRLNISGSAALPTPTKKAWEALSGGNILLERYGMTEVGMALSCGLSKSDRVDGSVGWPLPTVEVRLVDTETQEVIRSGEELDKNGRERDGEIQLRGPTIFKEYWNDPEATMREFVEGEDGKGRWFKTGDVAVRRNLPGAGKCDQEWVQGPMYFHPWPEKCRYYQVWGGESQRFRSGARIAIVATDFRSSSCSCAIGGNGVKRLALW